MFSDLAYGSGHYLNKLSEELKREGIIDSQSSIDQVSELVSALQLTSTKAADAVDTPPISLDGLAETISQLREEINKVDPRDLIPQAEVQRLWGEMEQAAERTAINAPMQGTAADIIKKAMLAVDSWLQDDAVDAHMIMQVHDELVLEVADDQVDKGCDRLCSLMSSAASLEVPLLVEAGVGDNWDEAH